MKIFSLLLVCALTLPEFAYPQFYRSRSSSGSRSMGSGMNQADQLAFLQANNVQCRFVDDQGQLANSLSSYFSRTCQNAKICIGNVLCSTGTFSFTFKGVACSADRSGQCLGPKSCLLESGFMDDLILPESNENSVRSPIQNEPMFRAQ